MGVRPDIVCINNAVALEKMKTGEIAAIASTAQAERPVVKLKPEPGFHFLSVDYGPKLADYFPRVLIGQGLPTAVTLIYVLQGQLAPLR
jgi:hypothetical protein